MLGAPASGMKQAAVLGQQPEKKKHGLRRMGGGRAEGEKNKGGLIGMGWGKEGRGRMKRGAA